MALKILPRSAWGARPAKSFTPSDPKKLKGVCLHWFGSPRAAHDHKDCPALLRGVQRTHMAPGGLGVKAGGSDIAYSHAVCPHGIVYTLRGFTRQTGANGNRTANRQYAAVVAMIGEGDKPSGELKDALRDLVGEWRARGAGLEVITHGSITGSECPGPELTSWVRVKAFEPKPPVRKPPVYRPPGVIDPVTTTSTFPFEFTTSSTSSGYTIDVTAGNVILTGQDPASPAVQSRLRKLFARFPSVRINWMRK